MVKAGVDFRYGDKIFKEGDNVPDSLVPELEKYQSHTLSTFVDVNGVWHKITDPKVCGWVLQRKNVEKRLVNFFKDNPKELEIVEKEVARQAELKKNKTEVQPEVKKVSKK